MRFLVVSLILIMIIAISYSATIEEAALSSPYVQFDGVDDWIDTGIIPDTNTVLELDAAMKKMGREYSLNGAGSSYDGTIMSVGMANYDENLYLAFGDTKSMFFLGQNPDEERHKYRIEGGESVAKFSVDEVESTENINFVSTTDTIALGAKKYSGNYQWYVKIKVYRCRIWQGGELVRDMVPMSDGTMYDLVNKQVYYNKDDPTNSEPLTVGMD